MTLNNKYITLDCNDKNKYCNNCLANSKEYDIYTTPKIINISDILKDKCSACLIEINTVNWLVKNKITQGLESVAIGWKDPYKNSPYSKIYIDKIQFCDRCKNRQGFKDKIKNEKYIEIKLDSFKDKICPLCLKENHFSNYKNIYSSFK